MSAEWVTAIATAGTFVVIAASALAALLQLRHVRGSNQIAALTECRETLESPEFRDAQAFVSYELPKRLADPVEWQNITRMPFQGEYEAIVTVANFFESLGAFVRNGIIDRRIACDLWYGVVLRNWNALLPVTTYVRRSVGRGLWENFEYLALLSQRYDDKYPEGTYPEHLPRMPEDPSLLEAMSSGSPDGVVRNG
jgi:hypothetical protein